MELNGKPFVPAVCPAEREGDSITPTPDQFHLIVDNDVYFGPDPRPMTTVIGYFGELEDDTPENNVIDTDAVHVPQDSSEARLAHAIHGDRKAIYHMGVLFCERVRHCHGVVDGECWALGARAVIDVVNDVGTRRHLKPD